MPWLRELSKPKQLHSPRSKVFSRARNPSIEGLPPTRRQEYWYGKVHHRASTVKVPFNSSLSLFPSEHRPTILFVKASAGVSVLKIIRSIFIDTTGNLGLHMILFFFTRKLPGRLYWWSNPGRNRRPFLNLLITLCVINGLFTRHSQSPFHFRHH